MNEFPQVSREKSGAPLILEAYFYLSALECIFTFLYDIYLKQRVQWWDHPTIGGMIILIGLFLFAVIFGYLGYYFHTHPQKALLFSNRLTKRNTSIFLFTLLGLVLLLFILIILNPSFIPSVFTQILYKRPTIFGLAFLLVFQTLCALFFLRVKSINNSLSSIYQKYSQPKLKIGKINKPHINVFELSKRYRFHILLWIVMVTYLIIGPDLYALFVLTNGKAVHLNQELPAPTKDIQFNLDRLDPIKYSGQDLYYILGWSFYLGDKEQAMYDRYLVLQSDTKTYFFPTEINQRTDLNKHFTDINIDLLYAGYSALISKDVIRPGKYHLGILFKYRLGNEIYYYESNYMVTRTANHLILGKS